MAAKKSNALNLFQRPRRLRQHASIRSLVQETQLLPQHLIQPIFVHLGKDSIPITSMPGQYRHSIKGLNQFAKELAAAGIFTVALFPVVETTHKCPLGNCAFNAHFNPLKAAIENLKATDERFCIIADVALDPYSSDGHDGLVENGKILNDESVAILAQMAVEFASYGADIIAPSDMMDGRVAAIRQALESKAFKDTLILSYTAKYASAFYGPFRDALDSAPKAGDKKSYQMDPCNRKEALIEAQLDSEEGADMLMVKPALPYLDVVADLAKHSNKPVLAYQVSGEYASLKAAIEKSWLDEAVLFESVLSIKRAGAAAILSYASLEIAKIL